MSSAARQWLGEYELQHELGSGSFARVFKVQKDGRFFAIKCILAYKLDAKLASNLQRECEIMQAYRHINLCHFFEHFSTGDCRFHCLVLEYCSGGDLSAYIRQRGSLGDDPLVRPNALDFLIQVARGLAFLCAHSVVHRDLKPANILLSYDSSSSSSPGKDKDAWPTLKVCDFGFAKVLGEVKMCETPCGRWVLDTLCFAPIHHAPSQPTAHPRTR